ncbi:MAG: histidinol-phosphatase HisJ family protein [Clostridiales bacterium]|nr:histidinol-phosphatase HisJ family protein [Clostridiales bacterium]
MYRADMHVHSTFSFDGKMEMEFIVQKAIEYGIRHIAFTEHLDLCTSHFSDFQQMAVRYFRCVENLRKKYDRRITIISAVEFAEPHRYPEQFAQVRQMGFDYLLGAVHFIDGKSIALKGLSPGQAAEASKRYYEELACAVSFGGFDAIAHFDHIRRGVHADLFDQAVLADIFREMIGKGIVLEINSSGIRRTGEGPFPSEEKYRLYQQLGGRRVVIGSDTHSLPNLYDHVEEVFEAVKSAGLTPGIINRHQFYPSEE